MSSQDARGRTHVVVIGDGAVLETLAAGVARLGYPTEVVRLVTDDGPALDACARLHGRALFALVRGGVMDRARVDRLRSSLGGLGVPLSRALVVDVLGVDDVARALERIGAIAARMGPADTSAVPPPPPPSISARSQSTVPPRAPMPTGSALALPLAEAAAKHDAPRGRILAGVALALGVAALGLASWVATQPGPDHPRDVTVSPATAAADRTVREAPAAAADVAALAAAPTVAVPALPPVEDAPELAAALKKREIRALDLLVIAPEAKKPMGFAAAMSYCAALEVAGVSGWRLPEIGELISMSRARFLRKGSVWSGTKGDSHGDLRLVLVIKRERISPIPVKWDGGRVVCVRERV